jgi:hypothetical protein
MKSSLKTCGGMQDGGEVFDIVKGWRFVREFKLRKNESDHFYLIAKKYLYILLLATEFWILF